MNFKKLISELKRRNVFKVATAYAITGWLIIQIVTSISEPLALPKWFDAVIIIFVLIGFPLSLLFAWAFEMTPEGLKKTAKVEVNKSVTKTTGKKLNRVIISVLSVFIIFLLVDKVFNLTSTLTETETSISKLPSIAVLPFVDMSPKNDQEYFSDGLSEELLNVLAKVNNIKVAGRTSSFSFKGKNDDLKLIGAELGVDHILEGSVRKSGNQIRITAQLIKVEDGFHMWSETYDKEYTANNLFSIQDEISKKILKELKIKLSIKDEKLKALTSNTEAYEAYLKGNQLLVNRKPKDIEEAIVEFKKAVSLDDQFAMAFARLATSYGHLFTYGSIKREVVFKNMRENIDKALLLNNNLGSAYAALGHYYKDKDQIFNEENNKSYKEAMKKAYELEPNNPEIIMWYGNSLDVDDDQRIVMYLKALEIDPLAPVVLSNLARTSMNRKEYKKAEEYAKKNIELNPEFIRPRVFLIQMLTEAPNSKLGEGFIETFKAYEKYPENLDVLNLLANLSTQLNLLKVSEEMEAIMTRVYPENPLLLGLKINNLMNRKKFDKAFDFFDDFSKKMNLKEGSLEMLSFETFKNQTKNPEINYKYIKKHHPVLLSDTLTTVSNELSNNLPVVITVLKKAKKSEKTINRLINIYIYNTEKEYKFNGDITQEDRFLLYKMENIAALEGKAKLYAAILNETYFNRNIKTFNQLQIDTDFLYDEIRNAPEIKEIHKRIKEDKDSMKAKAVVYLKSEGIWKNYKEANEK